MKINTIHHIFIGFLLLLLLLPIGIKAQEDSSIVDTKHQLYSYLQMLEDLNLLQSKYPSCFRYELRDSTHQGRKIPIVYLGDSTATKHIMIQASMHAREYMGTQLVMSMLEFYAGQYETGTYKQMPFRDMLKNVCLVVMPMVNPDGVEIAQKGEEGALTDDVKQWVRKNTKAGISHNKIKSNARGVDLNRNFRNGFGKDRRAKKSKNYSHYGGDFPYSETETNLMLDVSKQFDYYCFLNYHTSGNIIYYGCLNAPKMVNDKALEIAQMVKRHTKYPYYGPNTAPPLGSWADEVEILYKRPSVTIEIGSKNPVPIYEFAQIYEKNLWVWADLMYSIVVNS